MLFLFQYCYFNHCLRHFHFPISCQFLESIFKQTVHKRTLRSFLRFNWIFNLKNSWNRNVMLVCNMKCIKKCLIKLISLFFKRLQVPILNYLYWIIEISFCEQFFSVFMVFPSFYAHWYFYFKVQRGNKLYLKWWFKTVLLLP